MASPARQPRQPGPARPSPAKRTKLKISGATQTGQQVGPNILIQHWTVDMVTFLKPKTIQYTNQSENSVGVEHIKVNL